MANKPKDENEDEDEDEDEDENEDENINYPLIIFLIVCLGITLYLLFKYSDPFLIFDFLQSIFTLIFEGIAYVVGFLFN